MRSRLPIPLLAVVCASLAAAEAAPPIDAPPEEEQCLSFARGIESSVSLAKADVFRGCLNVDSVLDRAIQKLPVSQRLRQQFKDSFRAANDPGALLAEAVRTGSAFKFIRLRWVKGRPQALFRLLTGGAAVYQELLLAKGTDGKVQISDIFNYTLCEWLTASLRRAVLPLAVREEPGVQGSLSAEETEWLGSIPRLQAMRQQSDARKFAEALAAYDSLPASVRQDASVLILRHACAIQLGGAASEAACADLDRYLPPGCGALMRIDVCFANKEYDQALAALDAADKALGGEPYLRVLRARVLGRAGKFSDARAQAERAIDEEPALPHAHFTRLETALEEKNYSEAVKALTDLEAKLKTNLGDLTAQPIYAGLVKSKEYQEWAKTRGRK